MADPNAPTYAAGSAPPFSGIRQDKTVPLDTTTLSPSYTLPLISSKYLGYKEDIVDIGNNAGVNNITISASGADTITDFAATTTSYVISLSNSVVRFVATNTGWRVYTL